MILEEAAFKILMPYQSNHFYDRGYNKPGRDERVIKLMYIMHIKFGHRRW